MSPRIQIVERIENDAKGLEPRDVELIVLDVGMVRLDSHVRIEPARRYLRDLHQQLATPHTRLIRVSIAYQCFRLLDVLIPEEELPIEIAQVDRVQVDDVNLAEASEDEILEELAANTTSAHHKNPRLLSCQYVTGARLSQNQSCTCLMRAWRLPPRL